MPSWPLESVPGIQRSVRPSAASTPARSRGVGRRLAVARERRYQVRWRVSMWTCRCRRGTSRPAGPTGAIAPWSIGSARQVVPSCDVAGSAGSPDGFGIMISIGAAKLVTGVPASAQRAVTSTSCVPASRPMPSTGAGGERSTCRTMKSVGEGRDGQAAPAAPSPRRGCPGRRASRRRSAARSAPPAARSAPTTLSIVTATRNGMRVPLASSSSPESTCSPSASEPVANVSWLPETAGAGAAPPSSRAPGAVTGSEAVRTIWFAEAETEPSAGAAETSCRRGVVEADVLADRRASDALPRPS